MLVLGIVALGLGVSARSCRVPRAQSRRDGDRVSADRGVVVAILTTIGIFLSVFFEALRFFRQVSPLDFLFGLSWSPQTAIRADQVGSSGAFGAVPLFAGTLLISAHRDARRRARRPDVGDLPRRIRAAARFRAYAKPMLEILAGIPTVVYGYFAALTVGPILRELGAAVGLERRVRERARRRARDGHHDHSVRLVAVRRRDHGRAAGVARRLATASAPRARRRSASSCFPAALPGIVGAILLAVSRAIGETMIVVMAAGLPANLTANPFEAVTTVTVQIVTLLVGDQEFDSAKTLAAFALGPRAVSRDAGAERHRAARRAPLPGAV